MVYRSEFQILIVNYDLIIINFIFKEAKICDGVKLVCVVNIYNNNCPGTPI
jgi:hypothetical protein